MLSTNSKDFFAVSLTSSRGTRRPSQSRHRRVNFPDIGIDLSKINFESLAQRFQESKHRNTDLEALKAAIFAKLEKLIRLNRTRADFAEKFEALIESYNNGSRNIEQIYEDLLKLSLSLTDEEQRHVREHISEEELVIFDILTRPAPELTTEERAEVKKVARALLLSIRQVHALESGDVSAFHSSWFFERALRRYDALLGCAPDRRQP